MKRLTLLLVPAALFAAQARYARLGEFDGKVEVQLSAADPWMAAERNLPLVESAWLKTSAESHLEIELDEGSVWRLGPDSQTGISDYLRLSTGQRLTILSLDHGLAYFTGKQEGRDTLTLVVPGAQVTFEGNAKVRLEADDTWSRIAVMQGSVRFSSPSAEFQLHEGQTARVEPANPARFFLDREVSELDADKWDAKRDKVLGSATSAAHVIERYGVQDLDSGEWIQTADLGAVWKPKVPDGWVPYRNGRWRWYGALGYTWVSDDPWGWLPYHYGRWARREILGWVWAPADSTVFHPGEVYWLRGGKFAAWGPLAPGEVWDPADPDIGTPQQYLDAVTTYAGFQPDAAVIDPSGFTDRPKDPLKVAAFEMALPSPRFLTARLEATRPALRAGSTRVTPVVEGVTYEKRRDRPVVVIQPSPPPPVVVITEAPAAPPEKVEVPVPVAVPTPYPVAVYTGILSRNPGNSGKPPDHPKGGQSSPSKPPVADGTPGRKDTRPMTPAREKKFKRGEYELASEAIQDVNTRRFPKALMELDNWSHRYPDSDFKADRLYYLLLAYNGMELADKVVDTAGQLLSPATENSLDDPRQIILSLYLTSLSIQKIAYPSKDQFTTGQTAARNLADFAPLYFTDANRPQGTAPEDWSKARTDLVNTAKATLLAMARRSRR